MLSHRNLLFACHCYYADIDHIGPQRHHPARRAADARLGPLRPRPHRARLATTSSCAGSFEPERVFDALARHRNVSMFAAPTMVSRLINHPPARLGRHARPQDHHLRRRADVRRRPASARSTLLGPQALPALRPGREPDDHHRPRQGHARRQRRIRDTSSGSPRRRGAHRRRRAGRRRGRPRAAARRGRRDRHHAATA